MKRLLPFVLLLSFTTLLFAQDNYKKGYIIDNKDQRIECYILDLGWLENPGLITYKIEEAGPKVNALAKELKGFQIYDECLYEKHTVDIDLSSNHPNLISKAKGPNYEKRTLLLRVLSVSDIKLYYYVGENVSRFFVKKGEKLEQLVYKKYLVSNNSIAENNLYKGQLLVYLQGNEDFSVQINKMKYDYNDMITLFSDYASENNLDYEEYVKKQKPRLENKKKRELSRLKLIAAYGADMISVDYKKFPRYHFSDIQYSSSLLGLELEFGEETYNSNRTVVLGLSASYAPGNATFSYNNLNYRVDYDILRFSMPLGIRQYVLDNKFLDYYEYGGGLSYSIYDLAYYYDQTESLLKSYNLYSFDASGYFGLGTTYQNFTFNLRTESYLALLKEDKKWVFANLSCRLLVAYSFAL